MHIVYPMGLGTGHTEKASPVAEAGVQKCPLPSSVRRPEERPRRWGAGSDSPHNAGAVTGAAHTVALIVGARIPTASSLL